MGPGGSAGNVASLELRQTATAAADGIDLLALLDELHIPGVDDSLRALTLSRNRKLDPKMLREGDVAEIPDLVFEDEGIKHIRFDTSKQPEKARYEQIQKAWAAVSLVAACRAASAVSSIP